MVEVLEAQPELQPLVDVKFLLQPGIFRVGDDLLDQLGEVVRRVEQVPGQVLADQREEVAQQLVDVGEGLLGTGGRLGAGTFVEPGDNRVGAGDVAVEVRHEGAERHADAFPRGRPRDRSRAGRDLRLLQRQQQPVDQRHLHRVRDAEGARSVRHDGVEGGRVEDAADCQVVRLVLAQFGETVGQQLGILELREELQRDAAPGLRFRVTPAAGQGKRPGPASTDSAAGDGLARPAAPDEEVVSLGRGRISAEVRVRSRAVERPF